MGNWVQCEDCTAEFDERECGSFMGELPTCPYCGAVDTIENHFDAVDCECDECGREANCPPDVDCFLLNGCDGYMRPVK